MGRPRVTARPGRPRKQPAPVPRRVPRGPTAMVTVDAVVQAAECVLEKHGVEGLTTNRIAEVAGVSIGSLYQYFPNREAIVGALFDRYISQYARVLPRILEASGHEPLRVLIARIGEAAVDVYEQQPRVHRAMWELRAAAGVNARIEAQLEQLAAVAAAFLCARGRAPADAAPRMAFVIVHAIDGVANAIANRGGGVDARLVTRELAHMLTAYLEQPA